ncbi:kinesin motor domain protein [Necator americanus]|uniref:Kinesin motor domain protein n=1 Tax=Necator americanus TaxID=51031 RepID=W2T0S3_NECAM|nr:kinesin motor domain protein [Necator americanus]ETN74826.1 kinesin motor domain protein [Necator americanus]
MKGIVPTVCEELFKNIEEKKDQGGQYEVFISMFEIYCEKIRDLLSSKEPPKGGLKIREHPKTGFYGEFISKSPKSSGGTTTKKSEINLVDLAGSERQRDAGTEGDRMKEGIVINQSLSTLGRVIKALHEQQGNKGKKVQIAAISPADINYEETLSTLR